MKNKNNILCNYIEGQSVTCDMFGQPLVDGDTVVAIPNLLNTKGDNYSFNRAVCYTDGITGELRLSFSETFEGTGGLHPLFSSEVGVNLSQIIYKVSVDSNNFANTGVVDIFGNRLESGDLVLFSAKDTVLNKLHNCNFMNHVYWNTGVYSNSCGRNTQGRDERVYNCFGLTVVHAEVIKLPIYLSGSLGRKYFGESGECTNLVEFSGARAYTTEASNGKLTHHMFIGSYDFEVINTSGISEDNLVVLRSLLHKLCNNDIKITIDKNGAREYASALVDSEHMSYFCRGLLQLYLTKSLRGNELITKRMVRYRKNTEVTLGVYNELNLSGEYTLMLNDRFLVVKVTKRKNNH